LATTLVPTTRLTPYACLRVGKSPAWTEQQTGVAWATLKRHYAEWQPANAELDVFASEEPALFSL
jgi:hypothetical protein